MKNFFPLLKKLIVLFVFICISIFLLWFRIYSKSQTLDWDLPKKDSSYFIAHEGGGIDGSTYTNSIEAFNHSRNNGFTLFEFDFLSSSDDKLVAVHDWPSFLERTGNINDGAPLTHVKVNSSVLDNKYHPITSLQINNIFAKNSDLYLVTDKSNDFELIMKNFDFHDRIFVECFGEINYIRAVLSGIKRPMFSIGSINLGEAIEFAKIYLLNPKYVTVGAGAYYKHPKLFDKLHEKGIKIFVYTLNDEGQISQARIRHNAVIYTDTYRF